MNIFRIFTVIIATCVLVVLFALATAANRANAGLPEGIDPITEGYDTVTLMIGARNALANMAEQCTDTGEAALRVWDPETEIGLAVYFTCTYEGAVQVPPADEQPELDYPTIN